MQGGITEAVGERAGLVALCLCAAAIGHASVIDGDPMALVWPAGGLAVAWLMTRCSVREWIVDIPLLVAIGVAMSLLTGLGVVATAVLAVSNLVAVLTVVLALRWWNQENGHRGTLPTSTPRAMMTFLAATALGAFAGVAAGAVGSLLAGQDPSAAALLVWFGRNVCGMAVVCVICLLMLDRLDDRRAGRLHRRAVAPGRWPELALLFALTGALVLLDRLTVVPVSFLLPALAVWAGSRFGALPVAIHALFGGAGILWLTYVGHGPFSDLGNERLDILLAQLFVAMTLTIGLVLAAAREARAAMSHELRTFAQRAAHDLRNPLSVVESWTAELASTLATHPGGQVAESARMIAGIEQATARMRALVDSLLTDAATRGRAPLQAAVDLPDLVAEVASDHGAAGQVTTTGVPGVTGDPVLLRQLVDNLVANSLKYVRPGEQPVITVSTRPARDRVVVRVIDNGIGIPDGAHEWIFEPFRRAHESAYPGTGLGLSTCRRIVERHGGSMRALPRDDGPGTVFEFDLPQALAIA